MPHTQSAWKRLRQNEKRRKRNRTWVKSIKKEVRDVTDPLLTGDVATATTELATAAKRLDKAAAHGIIHKNKAARLKSRLAKRVAKVKANPPKPVEAKK